MRFDGRVAIVTGAGSGIGRAVVGLLMAEGASVAAVDWRSDLAESAVSGGPRSALAIAADVTRSADVDRCLHLVLEAYGRVDVLVNCAGIVEGDDVLTITEGTWDRNVESVLKSVYLCTRAVLPSMIAAGRGAIVNIASVNGLAAFGDDAYSAAKAGVISLTRSIAVRYGDRGIRCNAVAPGDIRTPRWAERLRADPDILDRLARWYPLGRVGEADDVAPAVLFLASDEASWITGTVLVVDGGLLAGHASIMRDAYPSGPAG